MKKFFVFFAVFATLIFVAGCGDSKNEDKTDTGDTVNDEDSVDTDQTDTEPTDTEPAEDPDSEDPDTTPEPTQDDNTDTSSEQNDDDADTEEDPCGEFEGAEYNEETGGCECPEGYKLGEGEEDKTCVEDPYFNDPCFGMEGAVYDEVTNGCGCPDGYIWGEGDKSDTCIPGHDMQACIDAGGTWNSEESICTKTTECSEKPEHSVWNGEHAYTQNYINYTENIWSDEIATEYSEDEGVCHFKCEENYEWNGSACVEPAVPTPCDGNPCASVANSNDECTAIDETNYSCGCNEGYEWKAENMTCKQYCGAVFNGTNSSARFNYNADKTPLLYPSQWTIEAWVKQTAIPDSDAAPLITMQNIDGDIPYMLSGISSLGTQRIILAGVSQGSDKVSVMAQVSAEYLNSWHHVALVYTGSALTIFVDGVAKGTKTTTLGPISTILNTVLWIGRASSTSGSGTGHGVTTTNYFTGTIDQIRFSNSARYSAAFTPAANLTADTGTVALWDFNGNTNDSSTNAVNLTGTNITYTTECVKLPECSTSNTGSCYDTASHFTWSKKADRDYDWNGALSYCDDLDEAGYTDWRLPNISELRTLVVDCSGTVTGGSCALIDTGNPSTSCLKIAEECHNDSCNGCTYDESNPGQYNRFGDTGYLWSSSTVKDNNNDDTNYAWRLAGNGSIVGIGKGGEAPVRCIR